MDFETLGKNILNETIAAAKGEYANIPQAVKDVMPKAALLVAKGIAGLSPTDAADYKHAMAILGNVKVGGQIALSELLLQSAGRVLAAGVSILRKIIGL